jgi:hypothetical protein
MQPCRPGHRPRNTRLTGEPTKPADTAANLAEAQRKVNERKPGDDRPGLQPDGASPVFRILWSAGSSDREFGAWSWRCTHLRVRLGTEQGPGHGDANSLVARPHGDSRE